MSSASNILFKEKIGNAVLFKNQQDLVNQLIRHPNSPYYLETLDPKSYDRAQSRLKTYISQLLSETATRNITEDLKKGLEVLLFHKTKDKTKAEELVFLVISDLREKNSVAIKSEVKQNVIDQFYSDLSLAQYISVITAKPLESDQVAIATGFSLSQAIANDILESLFDPHKEFKYYRLNFPLKSSGELFWNGLLLAIEKFLKKNYNRALFEILYQKFALKTNTLNDLLKTKDINEKKLRDVINEMLTLLNRNRKIMVFIIDAPIYTMPTIVINPGDVVNMKLYSVLDDNLNRSTVYKFSIQDMTLWRLFVWDKLKSKQFAGDNVEYSTDILFV